MASLAATNSQGDLAGQIGTVGYWRDRLPERAWYWSAEIFRILGQEPNTKLLLDENDFLNRFHPDDRDGIAVSLAAAIDGAESTMQARVLRSDGAIRQVTITCSCEQRGGSVEAISGLVIDVTEAQAAQETLRVSEARYRLLAEHSTDVVIQALLDSTRVFVSPVSERVLGYAPSELLGSKAQDLLHPEDLAPFEAFLQRLPLLPIGRAVTRQRYRRKNGSYVFAETTYCVTRDERTLEATGYVAAIRDITERHEAEASAQRAAREDSLTGLCNRAALRERLEATLLARREGTPFALLAIDLDRFKAVNDSFGHPAEDRLLQELAARMRAVAGLDGTVARTGGDEFTAILNGKAGPSEVRAAAKRMVRAIGRPVRLDGCYLNVGASVGVALCPADGQDSDTLAANADLALYKAKQDGRAVCLYDSSLRAAELRRLATEMELRQTLSNNALCLHYQPLIDLATQKVAGAEALVRWPRSDGRLTMPADFIPLAEESGLIVALGSWALKRGCEIASKWASGLRVAVNVSAKQFTRSDFEKTVVTALDNSGLDPQRLELEITESVLISDADEALRTFQRLKRRGVRIVLDDFGTGFSSLSYLRRFPFDKIKIDKSFVQATNDERSLALIEVIAELGNRFAIETTAEGIETTQHLEQVRAAGCRFGQGYLFGRPMVSTEFEHRICREATGQAA